MSDKPTTDAGKCPSCGLIEHDSMSDLASCLIIINTRKNRSIGSLSNQLAESQRKLTAKNVDFARVDEELERVTGEREEAKRKGQIAFNLGIDWQARIAGKNGP